MELGVFVLRSGQSPGGTGGFVAFKEKHGRSVGVGAFTLKTGRSVAGPSGKRFAHLLGGNSKEAAMKRFARLAGFTLLLGVVFVPAAHAGTHLSVQIGTPVPIAPVVFAPGPPPGFVWQPGYYVWTGFRYRWVPARWVPAPDVRRGWAA